MEVFEGTPQVKEAVSISKGPSCIWLWRSIITIFLILIVFSELMPSLAFKKPAKPREKPGKCPRQNVTCDFPEKRECHTDFQCKKNMKCCFFTCGEKCLDPDADICRLSPEVGECNDFHLRWFYSIEARTCKYFFYSGCKGNVNNFPSKKICEQTCGGTVRKGFCPPFPFKGNRNCSMTCQEDMDCPETYKCCHTSCGLVCNPPWKVKPWDCPPQPHFCDRLKEPLCQNDEECGQDEKCCSNCGLTCIKMKCPHIKLKCTFKEMNYCTKDSHCEYNEKCCMLGCGKKCYNPSEGAVGELGIKPPDPHLGGGTWCPEVGSQKELNTVQSPQSQSLPG
ncbi:WAP four-disulfide core domain protein 8-like [Trichosurus vulpecula]|uniref:WAP four-disulfide core domain protein 8-like n=1 Tax=Trichosurus vulpecula TaxID=9337 RepID=UPI00186B505E|nr:WAP four-disulfide core domain protein 8-like [Trichosurus vulpecula]